MTPRDARRRAANAGRRAADRVGARGTTVTIVVQQWSAAVGTAGATLSSTTSTALSPSPKVTAAGGELSAFGGGFGTASAGGASADEYEIGPITLSYSSGGYTPTAVLPVGAVDKTVKILLAGDGFDSGGEYYEVIPDSVIATRPHQMTFRAKRTRQ